MDHSPKIPLAVKLALILTLYFALSIALFLGGWQLRVNELAKVLSEEKEVSAIAHPIKIQPNFSLQNPTKVTFILTEIEDLVTANWPSLTNNGAAEGTQNRACRDLPLASLTLFPPWVTQDATYESIGRKLEGCMGRDKNNEAIKLCTGTRLEAKADICLKTKQIADKLYQFDAEPLGAVSRLMTVVNAVIFGSFQLIAIFVAVVTFHRAQRTYSKVVGKEPEAEGDIAIPSISKAVEEAKSGVVPGQISSAEIVDSRMRSYGQEVEKRLGGLRDRGDNIVQFGLLGTLTGMLLLFGSLEKAESSDPLTAQLSLSAMLGSLGLAFGTTIFAILLRMLFVRQLEPISIATIELIRAAQRRAREEMQNQYVRTTTEGVSKIDIWEEGAAILGGTKGEPRNSNKRNTQVLNKRRFDGVILLVFAILAGVALTFAFNIVSISGG
ncbi:MAG: MotA/TolQ/ExbB proton channel family protein [Rhizobiaceae bacterium]